MLIKKTTCKWGGVINNTEYIKPPHKQAQNWRAIVVLLSDQGSQLWCQHCVSSSCQLQSLMLRHNEQKKHQLTIEETADVFKSNTGCSRMVGIRQQSNFFSENRRLQ